MPVALLGTTVESMVGDQPLSKGSFSKVLWQEGVAVLDTIHHLKAMS